MHEKLLEDDAGTEGFKIKIENEDSLVVPVMPTPFIKDDDEDGDLILQSTWKSRIICFPSEKLRLPDSLLPIFSESLKAWVLVFFFIFLWILLGFAAFKWKFGTLYIYVTFGIMFRPLQEGPDGEAREVPGAINTERMDGYTTTDQV